MASYGSSEYSDTLFRGGVQGALSIITADGAVLVNVSGTNLSDRQLVTISPINGDIYFGYDDTVTPSTGTLLCQGQTMGISAGETVELYIVTASTVAVDVRITEVG